MGRAESRSRSRSPLAMGGEEDAGWSEDPTPPRRHPFTAAPGLTVPLPISPLGYLQLFLTRELLEYLMVETTDYASYMRTEMHTTMSYQWVGCNLADMARYLGLVIYFGLMPAPNVRLFWRRNFFMATPSVPVTMTRSRFLALDRYFHAFNRRAIPRGNTDRLILVRPVMDYLRQRCRDLVIPTMNLSLDEGMMGFKGALNIKVYNPKKPKKYGIKFFFLTESTTGYVIDFSVYSGMFTSLRDTVFGLVDRFRGQGYHLFMDNYYNSVSLAQELYDAGIHCSGTLRLVRGAPAVLKRIGKNQNLIRRSETIFRKKGDVFVILWRGVRLVPMITTSHEPMTEEHLERRKTRRAGRVHYEEVTVSRPVIIRHYTHHMGGVDLFDQMINYYSFARRRSRWTHKLNKYLLQLAVQNAFVMYTMYTTDRPKLSHYDFLEMAANALVNFDEAQWPSSSTGPIPRAPDLPVSDRYDSDRGVLRRRRHGPRLPAAAAPASAQPTEEDVDDPQPGPSSPRTGPASPQPGPSHAPSPPPLGAPAARDVQEPAEAMPAPATPARIRPGPRAVDPVERLQPGDHSLEKIPEGRQKRCRVCSMKGRRRDSRFQCRLCKVPLCRIDDCRRLYHTQVSYWTSLAGAPAASQQQ